MLVKNQATKSAQSKTMNTSICLENDNEPKLRLLGKTMVRQIFNTKVVAHGDPVAKLGVKERHALSFFTIII